MHSRVEARRWPLLVVAATALLTLAACGSSNSSSPSVASVPSGGGSGNSQPKAQQAGTETAARAAHDFAACLRAHGIQATDPVLPIQNPNNVLQAFGIPGKTQALGSAVNACQSQATAFERLALPPSPWGTTSAQSAKFAQCMRTTGGIANWPDPTPGENAYTGGALRQAGIDPSDPHVLTAEQNCDVNKH